MQMRRAQPASKQRLWLLVWGAVAVVVLLAATGGLNRPVAGLADPGTLPRWELPVAKAVRDWLMALTVGLLVLTATLLPPHPKERSGALGPAQVRALRLGAITGALWVVAGLVVLVLTYADVAGSGLLQASTPAQTWFFATRFDVGRSLALSALLSGAAVALTAVAARAATAGWAALLALLALLPLALTGHTSSVNHDVAVNAQAGHLVGVSVWVGGLGALYLLRRNVADAFPGIAARYSRLAGWCFALVALSGATSAWARLGGWDGIWTNYGALLAIKVLALLVLGAAGWMHRRRLVRALSGPVTQRAFARLALSELGVMAVAVGVGVALSRSTPQGPIAPPRPLTTAESLLGYPMPPPLDLGTALSQWRIDSLWVPVAVLACGWYLAATIRLRRRGDRWPLGRAVSWVTGCLLLVLATSASPGVYGSVMFSMHMAQHMTIATVVPVLFVFGAPVTLALRTLPRRADGSRGPREWLLAVVQSRALHWLGHPLVASALFAGSLYVFYFTPLFELAMRTHSGHVLMTVHFLVTGYLFASVIAGIDPGPVRPPYPFRMILLMVTFAFHTFFAVALMNGTDVLARDWFAAVGAERGASLVSDQRAGGLVSWFLGDYPIAMLAAAMTWGWIKSDERESRRFDRQAERDGDAALAAYNAYLRQLAEQPGPRAQRGWHDAVFNSQHARTFGDRGDQSTG